MPCDEKALHEPLNGLAPRVTIGKLGPESNPSTTIFAALQGHANIDHYQGFTKFKGPTRTLVGKIKEHRQKRTFWRDIERAF